MSVCSSIICPECGKIFDDSKRRPCIGKCRHTICEICKNAQESGSCPICNEAEAFLETVFNHQTIDHLNFFQSTLSDDNFGRFFKDIQNLGIGPCSKCNSECPKLRVCTQCTSLVKPSTNNGWRPSGFEDQNVALKIRNVAICANCVIDYHEGHKVVLLMSIHSITNCYEMDSLEAVRLLIERNWQKQMEAGEMSRDFAIPKSVALQWKVDERMTEIQKPGLERSALLILEFPFFEKHLQESLNEVRKYAEEFLNIRKLRMMRQKLDILDVPLMKFFKGAHTQKNLKRVKELVEQYETLPTDLLTREKFMEYDKAITQKLVMLTVEMASKHWDRRNDIHFLRVEVMKDQTKKTKLEVKKRYEEYTKVANDFWNFKIEREVQQPSLSVFEQSEMKFMQQTLSHVDYIREVVVRQLKVDEANVNLMKARIDELTVGIMWTKCVLSMQDCPPHIAFKYKAEVEEVIAQYEDAGVSVKTADSGKYIAEILRDNKE